MKSSPRAGKLVGYVGAAMTISGLAVLVVSLIRGIDQDEWMFLYGVLFFGGAGVMWLGGRIEEPGTRELLSERVSSTGPMIDGYVQGSHEVVLDGRLKPLFGVDVGGVLVTLHGNDVTAGSTDRWKLRRRLRRTTIRGVGGPGTAVALKVSSHPDRWRITDDFDTIEMTVSKSKMTGDALDIAISGIEPTDNQDAEVPAEDLQAELPGLAGFVAHQLASQPPARTGPPPWGDVRRVWRRDAALVRPADSGKIIGSVALAYTQDQRHGRGLATGSNDWRGIFIGRIELNESVSLPATVLALSLTLGKWSLKAPRIGEWQTSPNAGG